MRAEGGSGSGQSQDRFCFLVMLEGAFLPKLSPPLAAPTGGSMRPSYCPQLLSPGSGGGGQAPWLRFHDSEGRPPLWHSY